MTIVITFKTIGGEKVLVLSKEEALRCELGTQVKSLLSQYPLVVGANYDLPFFGKVSITLSDNK